jgi:hypothetical protein
MPTLESIDSRDKIKDLKRVLASKSIVKDKFLRNKPCFSAQVNCKQIQESVYETYDFTENKDNLNQFKAPKFFSALRLQKQTDSVEMIRSPTRTQEAEHDKPSQRKSSIIDVHLLVDDKFPNIHLQEDVQQPAVRPSISVVEEGQLECDKLLQKIQESFLKQESVSIEKVRNLFMNVLDRFKEEYDIADKRLLNIKLPKTNK